MIWQAAIKGLTRATGWGWMVVVLWTGSAPAPAQTMGVSQTTVRPANAARLSVAWTFAAAGPIPSSPQLADGLVYFIGVLPEVLYAVDARTGALAWSAPVSAHANWHVSVSGSTLLLGSTNGFLHAFDKLSGAARWSRKMGTRVSSGVVVDGIAYLAVSGAQAGIVALEVQTGTVRWRQATRPRGAEEPIAVANGIVYHGSIDGSICALDAATGAPRWSAHAGDAIETTPVVANGKVFVRSEPDKLRAFDALTGQQLWAYVPSASELVLNGPAVAHGLVYFGCKAGLCAVDESTGALRWYVPIGSISKFVVPAIAGDRVYMADGNGLMHVFDAGSGEVRAKLRAGRWESVGSVAAMDCQAYVGSVDGFLFALALEGGQFSAVQRTAATAAGPQPHAQRRPADAALSAFGPIGRHDAVYRREVAPPRMQPSGWLGAQRWTPVAAAQSDR